LLFIIVPPSLGLGNGCAGAALVSVFNNGRIMIPLEQMAAPSPSAADRKAANESENGVQLLYCQRVKIGEKKTTSRQFLGMAARSGGPFGVPVGDVRVRKTRQGPFSDGFRPEAVAGLARCLYSLQSG
jgi:hypothetical protein